jgi:hypothetical protein
MLSYGMLLSKLLHPLMGQHNDPQNNPGRNCKSWQVSTSYEIWWHDKSNIGAFTIVFHGFW